jgi:hypothetical protein
VTRFRYMLDPLCLAACAAYAFGRWYLQRHVAGGFWHDQFTDLLLIPAALPVFLWLQRRLGLRRHDERPDWREIGLHLAVWAVAAECIGPALLHTGTADWRDVLAYGAGAVLAGSWWSLA